MTKQGVWTNTAPFTLNDKTGTWTITWDHDEKTYIIRHDGTRVGSAEKMRVVRRDGHTVTARDLANSLRRIAAAEMATSGDQP